ncbi:outer membrane protein [Prochlorococcus sp. MIT 1307]|uniref:outer membrane protein n=1 Tax=Prochlorococcus sp. MIT 1307 TaxID=3096219 RepID=UPI002A75240B|nr:OmpW family outer membrane protein [Prochlorococcus sp. MIT 1307]
MSLRKSLLTASIVCSCVATPVFADVYSAGQSVEDDKGFYGVLSVGIGDIDGTKWESTIGGTKYGGKAPVDAGFSGEVGIGYDFGAWRTDLTYENGGGDLGDCTETKVTGTNCSSTSGEVETNSFMINAYYDIDTNSKWEPYVGAGIGTTNFDVENFTVGGTKYKLGDDDSTTYQLKAGVTHPVSDKMDLFGEAAYKIYDDIETSTNVAGVKFKVKDSTEWVAKLGLRYMF